jgi:hypothetical protein
MPEYTPDSEEEPEIWLSKNRLDEVLRRSVDDNVWDKESDEVWRGGERSGGYGRSLSKAVSDDT